MARRTGLALVVAVLAALGLVLLSRRSGPKLEVKPLQLLCFPVEAGGGWRVDTVLKVEVSNPGEARAMISDEAFSLQAGGHRLRPGDITQLDAKGRWMVQPVGERYSKIQTLKSRGVQPRGTAQFWLYFPSLLSLGSPGRDPAGFRQQMVDGLAALKPQLQCKSAAAATDLDPLASLPDPLPSRPSKLHDHVTVIDLPGGLNGCQLGDLQQRLKAAAFSPDETVVLLLGGLVDPCVLDWWPPAEGSVSPAVLSLARGWEGKLPDDVLTNDLMWAHPTRGEEGVSNTLHLPNEAQAIAAALPADEQPAAAQSWSGDEDPGARRMAIEALKPDDPTALDQLLDALHHDPDPGVRVGACETLYNFGEQATNSRRAEIKKALAAAAEDDNAELRKSAFRTAIQLHCAMAVAPTARKMVAAGGDIVTAYPLLAEAKDKEAVPLLLKRLEEGDTYALMPLRAIGDTSMLPAVREQLKADPAKVKPAALISLLADLGTPEDAKLLQASWRDDLPRPVKVNLVEAMASYGGDAAKERLLKVAQDDASELPLRKPAVEGLVQLKDPRAIPVFEKLAIDEYYRTYCLEGLVAIGSPEAKAALERLSQSDNRGLSNGAKRGLAHLAGGESGTD